MHSTAIESKNVLAIDGIGERLTLNGETSSGGPFWPFLLLDEVDLCRGMESPL
jgi:hypothetical protein